MKKLMAGFTFSLVLALVLLGMVVVSHASLVTIGTASYDSIPPESYRFLQNTGPFNNLEAVYYWSIETSYSAGGTMPGIFT